MARPVTNTIDSIMRDYVIEDLTTGCWEWQGGHHPQGYPMCRYNGKMRIAARMFLEEKLGQMIPRETRVSNQCGNVNCTNPDHYAVAAKGSEYWRRGGTDYRFTQSEAAALKAEWDSIAPHLGKRRKFQQKYGISDCMFPKIVTGTYKSKKTAK